MNDDEVGTKIRELRDQIWIDQTIEIERDRIPLAELGVLREDGTTTRIPIADMEQRATLVTLAIRAFEPDAMVMCYDGYVSTAKSHEPCAGKGCAGCEGKGYEEKDKLANRTDALTGLVMLPREPIIPTWRSYRRENGRVVWNDTTEDKIKTDPGSVRSDYPSWES